MSAPRPLALAVLWVPHGSTPAERQRRRYDLAQAANAEGYALLDMFDVGDGIPDDRPVYDTVAARAGRGDVEALLVAGTVDRARLDGIADRARLRVVEVRSGTP